MRYTGVKGMGDILPSQTAGWQRLEDRARKNFASYGFQEIRTPILEETAVFTRSIGETSDIVTKEMFTFADRKGRSLTMRPEGTAPIVRSCIEHSLFETQRELMLYYIGPMFRSERPQKGRSRQFHQIGAEIIGTHSPYADALLILQLSGMLEAFGIKDFTIKINSLGCKDDKTKYSEALKKYLKGKTSALCEDCRGRLDKNVLRTLDCKNESCGVILSGAPDVLSYLCKECEGHFEIVKKALSKLSVNFNIAKNLVRGLDYYTKTVFEITHSALGSQDAIAAGGRYDRLTHDMGGPDMGAIGYAAGMERLLIAAGEMKVRQMPVIGIATLGDEAKILGLALAQDIRKKMDASAITDIKEASLKSQFRAFDKAGASVVIIVGEDEIKKNTAIVRNMGTQEQKEVGRGEIIAEVGRILTL